MVSCVEETNLWRDTAAAPVSPPPAGASGGFFSSPASNETSRLELLAAGPLVPSRNKEASGDTLYPEVIPWLLGKLFCEIVFDFFRIVCLDTNWKKS